ncbi:hypothetical protein [Candidatus Electronema sp. PJ]|uniref:hypothetical protein n=1 Tax=Candidatus Electronema sp. PJ TaxID=3401572 RepID=UPI003AA98EA6
MGIKQLFQYAREEYGSLVKEFGSVRKEFYSAEEELKSVGKEFCLAKLLSWLATKESGRLRKEL